MKTCKYCGYGLVTIKDAMGDTAAYYCKNEMCSNYKKQLDVPKTT